MAQCPDCGGELSHSERMDFCDCGYSDYYPDAYDPDYSKGVVTTHSDGTTETQFNVEDGSPDE